MGQDFYWVHVKLSNGTGYLPVPYLSLAYDLDFTFSSDHE